MPQRSIPCIPDRSALHVQGVLAQQRTHVVRTHQVDDRRDVARGRAGDSPPMGWPCRKISAQAESARKGRSRSGTGRVRPPWLRRRRDFPAGQAPVAARQLAAGHHRQRLGLPVRGRDGGGTRRPRRRAPVLQTTACTPVWAATASSPACANSALCVPPKLAPSAKRGSRWLRVKYDRRIVTIHASTDGHTWTKDRVQMQVSATTTTWPAASWP